MTCPTDRGLVPVQRSAQLEHIGGGYESEVYRTDDHRYAIKLKQPVPGGLPAAVERARMMRDVAERFSSYLSARHTIPSYFVVADDRDGQVQVLVIQPYVAAARPLSAVDYDALDADDRGRVLAQLWEIVGRAQRCYRATGLLPDLDGLWSRSSAERARLRSPRMWVWHLWGILVSRTLLRSHNLLLTDAPERRLVLVDYDLVQAHPLLRRIYFALRVALLWRDALLLLRWDRRG